MTICLYFAPQTCARVTLTALEEIGVPFETRLVAFLAGEHRAAEFLAVNPSGKVPAIKTEDGIIVQNGAILTYLARTFPAAQLLPFNGNPAHNARILSQLFHCSADLHPLVTRFVLPQMMTTDPAQAPQIRDKAREILIQQLTPIDIMLTQQDWFFGSAWSILDAYLAWIWFRVTGVGFDPTSLPAVAAHFHRASARPSALAALAHEQRAETELARRGLHFTPPPVANQQSKGKSE
jgi:glutathione S-transferase